MEEEVSWADVEDAGHGPAVYGGQVEDQGGLHGPARLNKQTAPGGCPFVLKIPGGQLYLVRRPEGSYKWVDGKHASSELEDSWPDYSFRSENDKGKSTLMSITTLMSEYGYSADKFHYTWTQQGPEFQVDQYGVMSLQLLCGNRETIPAVYHPECEEWLERVGGSKSNMMRDWISVLRQLDEAVAALYLKGPGGIGKGMMALAVARMFGGAAASYEHVVLSTFNGALTQTPFVYLNEKAPACSDGSAKFRDAIGGNSYELRQKYKASATIKVAIRMLITANNADALRLGKERMDADDEYAIGRRIVYIEVPQSTKEWLREVGGKRFTKDWVEFADGRAGKLVQHFQWYVENWELSQEYSEMLVDGDFSEWKRLNHLRGGLGEDIYGAIAAALVGDAGISEPQSPVMAVPGDGVYVHAGLMATSWKVLTGSSKNLTKTHLGKEIGKLAESKCTKKFNGKPRQRVHRFTPESILEAAEAAGMAEIDHLEEILGVTNRDLR